MLTSISCFWPPPPLPTCTLQVTHYCFPVQTLAFTTSDMLIFAWAWSLQLSQQDPPPAPPGLGLTWGIYFHSLQLERWREAQKTKQKSKVYPTSIHAEEWGREGWSGVIAHENVQSGGPCPHHCLVLSSRVMPSKGGKGWDFKSSVLALPLMCCVTLDMSICLSGPQLP